MTLKAPLAALRLPNGDAPIDWTQVPMDNAWRRVHLCLRAGSLEGASEVLDPLGPAEAEKLVNHVPIGEIPFLQHFMEDGYHAEFAFLFERGASVNRSRGEARIDNIGILTSRNHVKNLQYLMGKFEGPVLMNYLLSQDEEGWTVAHYTASELAKEACIALLNMCPALYGVKSKDGETLVDLARFKLKLFPQDASPMLHAFSAWEAGRVARDALSEIRFSAGSQPRPMVLD